MKEPADFMLSDKNEKCITLLEQKYHESAKKCRALTANKLFIRFTDRFPGYSSRLYLSAKPQIGHSLRRSYLDECHSSDFLYLKQSLDIYVIIFCTNYNEF